MPRNASTPDRPIEVPRKLPNDVVTVGFFACGRPLAAAAAAATTKNKDKIILSNARATVGQGYEKTPKT